MPPCQPPPQAGKTVQTLTRRPRPLRHWGGKPDALLPGNSIPATDSGLVTASSRYGVSPDVRQVLASEDAAFLKRRRRGGRIKIAPVDRYEQIYSKQTLDPFAVNEAFRRAGVATPSAPPRNEE